MSVFTQEDVDALASMGNERFNSIYLANLNPRDYTVPNGNDLNKLKDFIRLKYVEKRWHRDGRGGSAGSYAPQDNVPANQPAPAVTREDSNRISLKLNTTGKSVTSTNFILNPYFLISFLHRLVLYLEELLLDLLRLRRSRPPTTL